MERGNSGARWTRSPARGYAELIDELWVQLRPHTLAAADAFAPILDVVSPG